MAEIRAQVVALFADVAPETDDPDDWVRVPIREWKHLDGRTVTEAEAELIGSATVDEVGAAGRFLVAEAEFASSQAADMERLIEIMSPYWASRLDWTVDEVADLLAPDLRAEFDEIAGRLYPDGMIVLPPR
jgi:hypothetical protein